MLPRLFREIVERADYHRRVAAVAEFNAESPTRLRGIACTAVKFGISFNTKFLNQANALVNIYLDGSVQVSTGAPPSWVSAWARRGRASTSSWVLTWRKPSRGGRVE